MVWGGQSRLSEGDGIWSSQGERVRLGEANRTFLEGERALWMSGSTGSCPEEKLDSGSSISSHEGKWSLT